MPKCTYIYIYIYIYIYDESVNILKAYSKKVQNFFKRFACCQGSMRLDRNKVRSSKYKAV